MTRADLNGHSEAFLNGWLAHKDNDGLDSENPYNENTQVYSFAEWESGWAARYDAVKHGDALSLDEWDAPF